MNTTCLRVLAAAFSVTALAFSAPTVLAQNDSSAIVAKVVDMKTQQPLSGVKVFAFKGDSTKMLRMATSDKNGTFSIVDLPSGDYRVELEKRGFEDTVISPLKLGSSEHLIIRGPIQMEKASLAMHAVQEMRDTCRSLMQPGQTGDVYVVCSGPK